MKILLTGGGSGGHFYPLVAVAEEINKLSNEKKLVKPELFFMSDAPNDKKALFENNIEFIKVPAGKVRRYFSLKNFTDFFKTLIGILIAVVKMFKIYPDVVFGKGGYSSFPTLLAARLWRIPVVIHESDAVPGRTNIWAGRFAERVALGFPEAAERFPKEKTAFTGNPVRSSVKIGAGENSGDENQKTSPFDYFKFDPSVPVLLVLGGSLGSRIINNVILDALPDLVRRYQIIHQAGRANVREVRFISEGALKAAENTDRYRVFDFLDDQALNAASDIASIIISRAGASAISEISIWGKPAIIIPITDSNGDHQRQNALSYASAGACSIIEEANLKPHILMTEIDRIIGNAEVSAKMSAAAKNFSEPDAGRKIAEEILNIALSHEK